jgi:hypothetical protein
MNSPEALEAVMPAPSARDPAPDDVAPPRGAHAGWLRRRTAWLLAGLLAALCTTLAALASRHTSTTFDEIVLMAGGARGWETGRWDLAPEHPPLMQYVYGLPIHWSGPKLPPERAVPETRDFSMRYTYAREFFWTTGNDPERLAFLGRLPAAVFAGLLVLATFAMAGRSGPAEGLLAAGLVAFLPDVLGHGGVAYNDVPLALLYVLAVAAADAAVRRPSIARGVAAGLVLALAVGVKFSAVAVLPAIAVLIGLEAASRRMERAWLGKLVPAALAGLVATYLVLVAIYRGDFALAEMRYGLDYTFNHVSRGHGAPGYLTGSLSPKGWRWFFPLAFLYKTPAALHLVLLAALVGFLRTTRDASVRELIRSEARAPLVGLLAFAAALMSSSLVIGFRYALPVLPLLCVLVAVGVLRLWRPAARGLRAGLAALLAAFVISSATAYPHFLGYTSEYGSGRDAGHELLADSSLDWGQGLLELRDYMKAQGIARVYLSYFGSALPSGYGIDYVPLKSFFPLPTVTPLEPAPQHAVISATNLHGVYLAGDPFAAFRELQPVAVLAHSLLVYRVQ